MYSKKNIKQARQLGGIYRALRSQTTAALDLSDILRAELVLAVSAFDNSAHEITRIGMLEVNKAGRSVAVRGTMSSYTVRKPKFSPS